MGTFVVCDYLNMEFYSVNSPEEALRRIALLRQIGTEEYDIEIEDGTDQPFSVEEFTDKFGTYA